MSERRRGLGRGLGALIPSGPVRDEPLADTPPKRPVDVFFPSATEDRPSDQGGLRNASAADTRTNEPEPVVGPAETAVDEDPAGAAYFAELPMDAITPNPRQPRTVFDEDALAELVHSIREVGLLQPVVVRQVGPERYELVMGERRWRAATRAGLATLPAIVRRTEDADLLRDALLENLHRSELNALEEAAAYDQLLTDFACTHEELATRIGRSRPQISNTLRLLKLPAVVQRRLAAGVLSPGHARALLGLEEPEAQERLAGRIVAEGLSVRAVEEIVALGDASTAGRPARRSRSARPVAPRLEDIAGRLSDRFETRVKVDLGKSRGKIVVEFASIDDLERIIGLMAPTDGGPPRS